MSKFLKILFGLTFSVLLSTSVVARERSSQKDDGLIDDIIDGTKSASNRFSDWLGRIGLSANLKIFKYDLFDGVSFNGGYKYEVEPSFTKSLFTRTDRYYFNTSLAPKSAIYEAEDEDFSVEAGLKHKMEIYFARQFNSARDAFKAVPYWVQQIPYKTENLENLDVGDYVSIRSNATLIASSNFIHTLIDATAAFKAMPFYAISGEFQVNILKLPDNKVRFKVVGLRRHRLGLNLKVGYEDTLELFGINFLDRRFMKIMDLNPAQLVYNPSDRNELLFVDYVMDLNHPEVREAYDIVIKKAFRFEEFKVLGLFKKYDRLKGNLVIDLAAIEKIVNEDHGVENPRILRKFKGSNQSTGSSGKLKLGIRLAKVQWENANSKNKIIQVDENENRNFYVLDSSLQRFYANLWFSWAYMRTEKKIDAVYGANQKFKDLKAENLVVSYEGKEKKFYPEEYDKLKKRIRGLLPQHVYDQIDFSGWKNENKMKYLTYYRYYFVIEPEFLDVIGPIPKRELKKLFEEYIKRNDSQVGLYVSHAGPRSSLGIGNDDRYDIDEIVSLMARALDPNNSIEYRVKKLMQASKKSLFAKLGMGFLMDLVPPSQVADVMSFHFNLSTAELDEVRFDYGKVQESDIYRQILLLQSIMYNNGLDLRLESETLSQSRLTGK